MRQALEKHLRHEPEKLSKSRIKRLRGLSRPRYRLASAKFESSTMSRAMRWKCSQSSQVGGRVIARPVRKSRVKKVSLSEVKDDLSRYLREAENREVVITRHGKPAGVLIGFASEDDWFDYRLENDARFLARIEKARASLRAGQGVRLEDVE